MNRQPYISLSLCGLLLIAVGCAQTNSNIQSNKSAPLWSVRIGRSLMAHNPDMISYANSPSSTRWGYERGVVLQGIWQLYLTSGDSTYLAYIKKHIDQFVDESGTIKTYEYGTFNIDNIATGRQLLALFKSTRDKKYKIAADTLRKQLANHPKTNEGGFWHKKIYPYQMWLDGLYMAEPFYAEYAQMAHELTDFDDITNQFIYIERHTRDQNTGLLYHAWDESKKQKWSDSITGCSPHFWGRAMGWYAWALVDVLDFIPEDHPKRAELIAILQRLSTALIKYRDYKSGLWYQVVDQGNRAGNYLESSASCMFIYAFARGANKGYLDTSYYTVAQKSFQGIIDSMVTLDDEGLVNLHHTCQGAGLGGNPYRDGSYEYYISEKQRTNDFKAIGPFILAALELEKNKIMPTPNDGK